MVLLSITHHHYLGPCSFGPVEQLSRLAVREQTGLIHDPELRSMAPLGRTLLE